MLNKSECFIIGGGPSLKDFDFCLLQDKDTIAVNKSILDVPSPNYFITVDFTFLRKLSRSRLSSVDTTKVFVACLNFDYIKEEDGRIIDTKHNIVYDLSDFDLIIKSRGDRGIGYQYKDFKNGLNSGYCALQYAVILGCTKIYLMGIDLCLRKNKEDAQIKTHYHDGYGQNPNKFSSKLEEYFAHFAFGLQEIKNKTNIKVISLSPISRLNNIIDYVDYREVM